MPNNDFIRNTKSGINGLTEDSVPDRGLVALKGVL